MQIGFDNDAQREEGLLVEMDPDATPAVPCFFRAFSGSLCVGDSPAPAISSRTWNDGGGRAVPLVAVLTLPHAREHAKPGSSNGSTGHRSTSGSSCGGARDSSTPPKARSAPRARTEARGWEENEELDRRVRELPSSTPAVGARANHD